MMHGIDSRPRWCRGGAVAVGVLCVLSACDRTPSGSQTPLDGPPAESYESKSYLERLGTFKSHLTRRGPAPQPYRNDQSPPGVQEITYPSGSLQLKAWVAFPDGASAAARVPGVVYFHGGYAFGPGDFKDARPFLEAGFALMCPTLRGENGNPGSFEMYLGEVDDAKAALAWFAAQDRVDASRVYTFGHSAGGIISALLSLHDVPVRHGGSSGGLYGPSLFDYTKDDVPFLLNDPREREVRVLVGNVRWMKRKHHAFVGNGDRLQDVMAARREMTPGSLLQVVPLPGDHHSSLAPAVKAYVERIRNEP